MPTSIPTRSVPPPIDMTGWLVCSIPVMAVLAVFLANFAAGHGLGHLFRSWGCAMKYAGG